jgi:LuxR family maltose regulon positive regulatory protein
MEHVLRPRLVARLQKGLAHKLILISAPAGYGKTTLLCEWLATGKQLCAWVSLDKGDNDLSRFWAYVLAALQSAFSSAGKTLPDILLHHSLPISEALIPQLINELDKLQQPLILVLDDYHNIETQVIHDGLSFLLEHAPAHFHLVLATRADPPLPLARLRAHSQMLELRLADLRFSTQEITEFLRRVMSLDLSETDLSLLETSTEGWIAGLQMAGLSLQGKADASSFISSFSGEDRYILDFLFEEVFQRQSEDIRNFLLQTSILERLCDSLCNAVTLREDSHTILDILERNNLFLISLDEQRQWYRYHHLFADLLRSRLKLTSPDSIASLHQRASAWYVAEHDLENAIAHALVARDFEHAARLIEQIVQNLDMLNKQAMLTSWVNNLPPKIMEMHPWLCVYRAWGDYWSGTREMEEDWLQAAERNIERTFEAGNLDRKHIEGSIAALRAHIAIVDENIPRALEMGRMALDLLPEGDPLRIGTTVALGAAYWGLGDVIQSELAFGMGQASALKVNNRSMAVGATGYLGIQKVKQGRLQDAIATYRDGLRMDTLPNGIETPVAGFLNVRLGDVSRERNDLALASKYLNRGVEQCIHLSLPDILTDAYVCLGRYQLAADDLEGTLETLQKADRVAQQTKVDQWVLCWLDDLRLKSWLAAGNLEAASLWAKNSGLSLEGPFSYQHDLHHQNLARVLVAQSVLTGSKTSHDKALALLERLRVAAEQAGWVHEEIRILVMQAINCQAHKEEETALKSMLRAIVLAEPGGYVRVFIDEGKILRGLLTTLANYFHNRPHLASNHLGLDFQENQVARLNRYVCMLLSAFDKSPERATLIVQQTRSDLNSHPIANTLLVEQLSAREMEVLNLLAQGCSNKKIAESLVIARETVHKHLKNIYGKLGVHSRTEAIAHARELGLL